MIYLDSSVVLSRLFQETVSPTEIFWSQRFVSSELLRYEVMNRVNSRAPNSVLIDDAAKILNRTEMSDLGPAVLIRAQARFPIAVRTLDGLHLATIDYLIDRRQPIQLATYDKRLSAAASAVGIPLPAL